MGRLIDADALKEEWKEGFHKKIVEALLDDAPTIEAIPKAEYEARLKADIEAILVELQLEIEEKATEICDDGWWLTYNWLIQQKINKLKGEGKQT